MKAILGGLSALLATSVLASSDPSFDNHYKNHPYQWFDEVSQTKYFTPGDTSAWQLNETCSNNGISVAQYNIFHNVGLVSDFGDEMEGSLGEVIKCADVVILEEAWDYDDIREDGPDADMRARGFNYLQRGSSGYYCDNTVDIELDCSGLYAYSKYPIVKDLGHKVYSGLIFPDKLKAKGVTGLIVRKDNRYFYIFNTHLTYGTAGHFEGSSISDNSRASGMSEAVAFIREAVAQNSAMYPPAMVLFGGDFNADFSIYQGTMGNRYNTAGEHLVNNAGANYLTPADYYTQFPANMGAYDLTALGSNVYYSNWTPNGHAHDSGPNFMAGGGVASYDAILISQEAGNCSAGRIDYSGWAPVWKGAQGQRIWPSYTHSDHYGTWLKATDLSCQ